MISIGDTSADTSGRWMRRRECVDIPREGCFFISHRWHESLRISLSTDCTDDTDFMHRSRSHAHPEVSTRRSRQLRAIAMQPLCLCVLREENMLVWNLCHSWEIKNSAMGEKTALSVQSVDCFWATAISLQMLKPLLKSVIFTFFILLLGFINYLWRWNIIF